MDLIPGVVLFTGAIGIVALLGWDTFQNRISITKAEMKQSRGPSSDKPNRNRKGLFNRG